MKRLAFLLTIYVLVHSGTSDSVRSYDGQSMRQVLDLMAIENKTFDFITEKEYTDFLKAHEPKFEADPVKVEAKIELNDRTNTVSERIDAMIRYLDMDK